MKSPEELIKELQEKVKPKNNYIMIGLAVITFIVIYIIINGLFIMWLWNWLVVSLFGLPNITFLQSVGLNLLISTLFNVINLGRK